jgi:hypothetical protein
MLRPGKSREVIAGNQAKVKLVRVTQCSSDPVVEGRVVGKAGQVQD